MIHLCRVGVREEVEDVVDADPGVGLLAGDHLEGAGLPGGLLPVPPLQGAGQSRQRAGWGVSKCGGALGQPAHKLALGDEDELQALL